MPVAVVDLETTGMSTDGDRIVEIAVLRLEEGKPPQWLDSRVNPLRSPGPTHVHGLSARDLRDAPLFADLAPALGPLLDGAVMVAHNAGFEHRFLAAELEAAGGHWAVPRLCTVKLSRRLFPDRRGSGANTLGTLARHYGIVNAHAHRAMGDVLATAELLGALLTDASAPVDAGEALQKAWSPAEGEARWPIGEAAPPLPRAPRLRPPEAVTPPPDRPWRAVPKVRRQVVAQGLKLSELRLLCDKLSLVPQSSREGLQRALVNAEHASTRALLDWLSPTTRQRVSQWVGVAEVSTWLAA